MTVLVSVLMVLGLAFIQPLSVLLGATGSMERYTPVYARFILIAMPFKAAVTALSCILRFQGYSRRSMYGLGSGRCRISFWIRCSYLRWVWGFQVPAQLP